MPRLNAVNGITQREGAVLLLIKHGKSHKEIATILGISTNWVNGAIWRFRCKEHLPRGRSIASFYRYTSTEEYQEFRKRGYKELKNAGSFRRILV